MCPFTHTKTAAPQTEPKTPIAADWRVDLSALSSTRIRGIVVGLIVSLALGMVPLTLFLVKQDLVARAGETVALAAADIADKLDIVLLERLGDIQAFARSPVLAQNNPEQIVGYLEQLKQLYPMYERLSVVNSEGRVVASSDHAIANQSWQSEDWFHTILKDGRPHVELVRQPGRPDGSLRSVRFTAQLRSPNGTVHGAIATEIDERIFRAFAAQTTQRSGRSATRPEITEFLILSKTGDILLTSAALSGAPPARNPVPLTSTGLANQGHTGFVEEVDAASGTDALTGYARMAGLPQEDELRWRILVRADRGVVLHSIWTLLWKLVGIATACLLPLLGLFYWSWRRQAADEVRAAMARHALEANEARIRKIVDIALDAVITIDERGLVTGWNPQAEHIFGWSGDEVIGQSLTNTIIPPRYREGHERGLRQYAETGTGPVLNKRIEVTALDRHGREFPVELAITPMHLDGQTIFSAFLRDITERKQAEDELRRTQAAAESANRAKTEFLANMSHELRTPLNAIVGTSDVLLKTTLTPDQRQCALMSQRASQALLRLVNDVLDLAKIEAGTVGVESAPFDLAELLERTKRLMELRQLRTTVALTFALSPDVPTQLEGDGFRLQQILLNLVGNALKFTERGSVSLTVSRVGAKAHRTQLQFVVGDTGIGIPADQLDHIFGRFTQVDSGDNRKYGGAGLGLSICKQLVQLMEGTIHVSSVLGQGSTFTVTLPFTVSLSAAQAGSSLHRNESPKSSTVIPASAPSSAPLTILLVDDSPEIGQLASLYLKNLPYRLDHAGDGATAVQRCQAHRYDLIFLDLQMPGMDGYATARALRGWEETQKLPPAPVVALTADVLGPAQERSRQAGCTGFIGKPFSQATFLDAIQHYATTAPDQPTDEACSARQRSAIQQTGEQDLERLRQKFLSNRWRDLEALASALSTHDWATIRTLGHRMKGLAGSYGLEDIGTIGARLEQAAAGQEMDRIASGIQELVHTLQRLDPSHDRAA